MQVCVQSTILLSFSFFMCMTFHLSAGITAAAAAAVAFAGAG
jgi:hypothetical protein